MMLKSLGKWCTVAVVVALFLVWGSQAQQSAWQTQVLAEGPDESKKRVLTLDIAVVGNTVYVSYVDQAMDTVWLLISTEGGVSGSWKKVEVTAPKVPVANTTVAAFKEIVCVAWQQLGDAGPEVWQRCGRMAFGLQWLIDPMRVSSPRVVAGQSGVASRSQASGSFDNAAWTNKDGPVAAFIVWSEDLTKLKVMKSADGTHWTSCADIPGQSSFDTRYPSIYVDRTDSIWLATAQNIPDSDILVWVSNDQCTSWRGPTNTTFNNGFSDGPGIARLGNKLYIVNDDGTTTTGIPKADINFSVCDLSNEQSISCTGTRALYKNAAFPQITADSENLHVVAGQFLGVQRATGRSSFTTGYVVYCFSQDGGQTLVGNPIPDSEPVTYLFLDKDFGQVHGRVRMAVDASHHVYIVWTMLREGKSKIMLSM